MRTPQAQIKLNLPLQLKEFVESRANRLGLPLSNYIKHLIIKDVENSEYPTFQPSPKTEKLYKKARQDESEKKLVQPKNLDAFLDEL